MEIKNRQNFTRKDVDIAIREADSEAYRRMTIEWNRLDKEKKGLAEAALEKLLFSSDPQDKRDNRVPWYDAGFVYQSKQSSTPNFVNWVSFEVATRLFLERTKPHSESTILQDGKLFERHVMRLVRGCSSDITGHEYYHESGVVNAQVIEPLPTGNVGAHLFFFQQDHQLLCQHDFTFLLKERKRSVLFLPQSQNSAGWDAILVSPSTSTVCFFPNLP